jgi:Patatin-like phospholipase
MASVGSYTAKLYPAVEQPGTTSVVGAVCFSGGGSRALSCALGQLSALTSQNLLQNFSFISSVSGGSWASVLYTFLPSTFSDSEFLITPLAPGALSQSNMQTMPPTCLGSVPQQFGLDGLSDFIYLLYKWGFFDLLGPDVRTWFWIAAVGEMVLKPFNLYSATYATAAPYLLPASPFSVSTQYVEENLVPNNPGLQSVTFYTVAAGRPTLIVNTNLLNGEYLADPPQMPIQAMAVSTGSPGSEPGGSLIAGGSVESFGFASTLTGGTVGVNASFTLDRWYSLCDIAGCSSAFFAEYLLQYIDYAVVDLVNAIATKYNLAEWEKDVLEGLLEAFTHLAGAEVLPAYNYWPLSAVSETAPVNATYGFSDGGNFDNSGILGALAQTNVNRIVAFINSEVPINAVNSAYFIDSSVPLLFGSYYPDGGGPYQSYGGMSPTEPMSYVQVFDNASGELDALCAGLDNASCGGPNQGADLGTYTAVYTQTLTTVSNPVAGIEGGRQVTVVWIYNNRVNNWQGQIKDAGLLADLTSGQADQQQNGNPIQGAAPLTGIKNGQAGPVKNGNPAGSSAAGSLANFPYYSTGEQIYLDPEAVTMLAQLSAWNVQQAQSQIEALFTA